jgi:formylglycine-generating enzyme required for sulfatase activity
MVTRTSKDLLIEQAREVLALDPAGIPVCQDTSAIFGFMLAIDRLADKEVAHDLLDNGFLRHAPDRRGAHVDQRLVAIPGATFDMGSDVAMARHFCGETPGHTVELSPFQICATPTTNEMFALLDPTRRSAPADVLAKPVVDVTWFDAAVFARWVGCRLPTEAEWEFACGAGTAGDWCCEPQDLPRHAWYSENAERRLHPTASREPNALGIFDMSGNVWEWCHDVYAQDYYSRSPERDPVNDVDPFVPSLEGVHRVSRGGGFLALAEMCRIRYRLHDPAGYSAADLGFRIAG